MGVFIFDLYIVVLLGCCVALFVWIMISWAKEIGKRPVYLKELMLKEKERKGKMNLMEKAAVKIHEIAVMREEEKKKNEVIILKEDQEEGLVWREN